MKPNDRVELMRDLDDLKKGMRGTCVITKDHASKTGVLTPMIATGHSIDVLGIQFDAREFPSVARMIGEQYIFVKDHCHVLD